VDKRRRAQSARPTTKATTIARDCRTRRCG
jgi:hypothetical protein